MTGLLAHTGTRLPGSRMPPTGAPGFQHRLHPPQSQAPLRSPPGLPGATATTPDSGAGQAGRGSQLGPFLTRRWGNASSLKMCGR